MISVRWSLGIVVVFTISSMSAIAQQASVFSFLRYSLSARHAGLAGATVAMPNDASSILVNPASVVTVEDKNLSATFLKHVVDINSGAAVYTGELGDSAWYAVSAVYTSYGAFERADETGNRFGSFGGNDVAFGFTYGNEIDSMISYGATAKFIYSGIDDMASTAVAIDAGLHIRIPKSRTNLGISVMNLGAQLSTFDGTTDRLPVDVRIGVNHQLRGLPLLVNASINHLADDVESFTDRFLNFSVGGELSLGKALKLRVGYDNATRNRTGVNIASQLAGLSGGVGIILKTLTIDYAVSTFGSAALLHRFSVATGL